MTQDEIIRLATEVWGHADWKGAPLERLERFAALVAEPWIETNKALAKEIIELKKQAEQEHKCKDHPDAPHGFDRNASHNAGRYVCECEGWEPEQAEQEPMYISESCAKRGCACHYSVEVDGEPVTVYAAPVRTKDLTDDEIHDVFKSLGFSLADPRTEDFSVARAVIAAYKEKNK